MRLVTYALYILLSALTSFQTYAHDGSPTAGHEIFLKGRTLEREGKLLIAFHQADDRVVELELSPDHRPFKNQDVWVSGFADKFGHFTVKSLITKPNTWINKGVGQGLMLQGRVVPRKGGGLDFYPVQPRAVELLGRKKSFKLAFAPDMEPPDVYSHLVQVRGIVTDGLLIVDPEYGTFQILEKTAKVKVGDAITWSGTLDQGNISDGFGFGFFDPYDYSTPRTTTYEMFMPGDFQVLDKVTGKYVPASFSADFEGYLATVPESVNRVELLRRFSFTGKLQTERLFAIDKISPFQGSGKLPVNLEEAIERQLGMPPMHYESSMQPLTQNDERPVDRKGLRVINGDRQRPSADRLCEIEAQRSRIHAVQEQQQQ